MSSLPLKLIFLVAYLIMAPLFPGHISAEEPYSKTIVTLTQTLKKVGLTKKVSYNNKAATSFYRRASSTVEYNIDPAKYGYTFNPSESGNYFIKAGMAKSSSGPAAGVNFMLRW